MSKRISVPVAVQRSFLFDRLAGFQLKSGKEDPIMKKKVTELAFTINKHSMALTFRRGTPTKARSTLIGPPSADQPQSAKEALANLKRVTRSLAASTHGLAMEVTALSQAAKINGGGKFPDINAIMQQVLDESTHSYSTGGGTDESEETNWVSLC